MANQTIQITYNCFSDKTCTILLENLSPATVSTATEVGRAIIAYFTDRSGGKLVLGRVPGASYEITEIKNI